MNIVPWPYELRAGHSADPSEGACAMAAIGWLAHGKHDDHPECACPVIGASVICANDYMPYAARQRFLPYLHRIAGSRSLEHERIRLRIFVLAAARVFAANALDEAGLYKEAATLRALSDNAPYPIIAKTAWEAGDAAMRVKVKERGWVAGAEAVVRVSGSRAAKASWAVRASAAVVEASTAGSRERAATWAAMAGIETAWDDYFDVLDAALSAGPQGEPWSTDHVANAAALYEEADGG